jgi:hypothetical protein
MKQELADISRWSREANARNEVVYRYGMGVLSAPLPSGAKLTRGDREHAGVAYMYRSVFGDEEAARLWLSKFPEGVIVKTAFSDFDGHCVCWFSVNR